MDHKLRWEESMPKMCAVQVPAAGRPFGSVEQEIPEPKAGQVRVKVQAGRGAVHERGVPPGASGRSLRAHEERPSAVSSGSHNGLVAFASGLWVE